MKILVSWLALHNDFDGDEVNKAGPNFNYHRFYYAHDVHLVFTDPKAEVKADFLVSALRIEFPTRRIEKRVLQIDNISDLKTVKIKMEQELLDLKSHRIDIFFSPGSSMMQLSWYILHTTLGLNTRLLQLLRFRHSKDKNKPDLVSIDAEQSQLPISAVIRQRALGELKTDDDFLLDESVKPVYEDAYKIAQTNDVTVLISGDTGTGKEYLAHYIHNMSARKNKTFASINCSGLSDQLLESRLFGYKKGSFTGAYSDHKGLFRSAEQGTVFLDEIADITPYMQQVLLRALQNKEIQPIGEPAVKTDVRIIAAANQDLYDKCGRGEFRFDLFYRIAVTDLHLPTLLERGRQEKEAFINFFLDRKRRRFNRPKILKLDKELYNFLLNYTFPGNIRELENLIDRFYVFNKTSASIKDLPLHVTKDNKNHSLKLEAAEKTHILKVYAICNENKKQTARTLGIALNTLKNKLKKYGDSKKL
ncbi:MAG: sigma 54-interacting transcriptional regulator [Bacteroidota bacterium]|nr:sigma 54-interacting transcriptional regulator [Bacteroidota bacterium]